MSIDSTFKPMTANYAVDSSAAVRINEAQGSGVSSFRIRNTTAANAVAYVAWGPSAAATPAANAAAPAVGTPKVNSAGIPANGVVYLEVPANSFFIGSAAAPNLEICGGEGGNGG